MVSIKRQNLPDQPCRIIYIIVNHLAIMNNYE